MTLPAMAEASNSPQSTAIGTKEEIIAEVSGLVSPPSICVKLYNLINSSRASASDIGETLELDPNLVARVLRIVNSAAYSFPAQISTVSRAVTILGTQDLCNIVMAIAAVRSFSKMDGGLYSLQEFWHHSVYIGLASRHLAKVTGLRDPESFFIAGLLHDVGIPVLYGPRPTWAESMKPHLHQSKLALAEAEQTQFGFDHAEVAASLLESWCLPPILIHTIAHHYGPYDEKASVILRLADACEYINEHTGTDTAEIFASLPSSISTVLGLAPESLPVDSIIDKVNQEHQEVLKALMD